MRKQESVHLHALLVAVADYLEDRPEAQSPGLAAYRDVGMGPSAIHRSKDAHEDALLALAADIDRSLRDQPTPGAGR